MTVLGGIRPDYALDILALFTAEHPVWTFDQIHSELATRHGESSVSLADDVHNLLKEDYLEPVNGAFQLGSRVFELARLARRRLGLVAVARPSMRALGAATGKTIFLTKRIGMSALVIDVVAGPDTLGLPVDPATVLPINASVAAQVLFAWLPSSEVDELLTTQPLLALTPLSITAPARLHERLAQIRFKGWGVSSSEYLPGWVGIAAPIVSEDAAVRAALTIGGHESELTEEAVLTMVPELLRAAKEVSERLAIIDV